MAASDFWVWPLGAAIVVVVVWYFVHVALGMWRGIQAIRVLPAAVERAFDGSVPPWLRLVRLLMIMVICFGAAWMIARKLGI